MLTCFASSMPFGDLHICNLDPVVDGQTVRGFLANANIVLGGGSVSGLNADTADVIAAMLDNAFKVVTDTLRKNTCSRARAPARRAPRAAAGNRATWRPTPRTIYGASNTTGGALLGNNFAGQYPSGIEIGISGSAGKSLIFTSASAVYDYLPQTTAPAALDFDMINPTSSASGALGADVLALELNVHLSDANLLASATPFGDLHVCNFNPLVNGQTVRSLLASANTVLGGGSVSGWSPSIADTLAVLLNNAFLGGSPSSFGQTSLVAGPCP